MMAEQRRCKIVIFGAFGVGKTTLIKTLDPDSHHVEADCAGGTTTVALDFGRVLMNGSYIHIFGTPGQERFEFAREIIGKGMDGAILLLDATNPVDDFIRHLYNSLITERIPLEIFINKCDCIGARPELIEHEFRNTVIRKVSAKDRKQSLEAVCTFTQKLLPYRSEHVSSH
jgi:uncharacterized protein